MTVLGIEDPMIWGCYILIILFTIICVVYGIINWNKGGE
ncbi:symporter small accessory protein [Methanobrevibacter sp.]